MHIFLLINMFLLLDYKILNMYFSLKYADLLLNVKNISAMQMNADISQKCILYMHKLNICSHFL